MTRTERTFLSVLRMALRGEAVPVDTVLTAEEWKNLIKLSIEQEILPLICNAVYGCPSFRSLEFDFRKNLRDRVLMESMRRIIQTNEFLTLILHAQMQGLNPLVIKGISISSLYPQPCLRPSVDEDLLIDPEETEQYHAFLLSEGFFADDPETDRESVSECSYHKEKSPSYIELHKMLFAPDSKAYGDLNALFEGTPARTEFLQIEDVTIRVLSPTDHLLYLLCHIYKHFLHSGAGIRHIADVALFSNAHEEVIDWEAVFKACRAVRIENFAAAVFQIAHKYLTMNSMPSVFAEIGTDEGPLLEDTLTGGLYGNADIDRAHSGNITLAAAAAGKGKRDQNGSGSIRRHLTARGLMRSLFPGSTYLQNMFPYAKAHPVLTPIAWAHRIINYLKRRRRLKAHPARSVLIGQSRIKLMKRYKLLDE